MKTFGFQWHLTHTCNLRCTHCYQSDYADSPATETLPTGTPAILIDFAETIFKGVSDRPVTVNLTGGEPLLLGYLFHLTTRLHEFSNLHEINIITNGTIAAPEVLSPLAKLKKLALIRISIEGGDAATDNAVRGPGHFETVKRNIPLFQKHTGKPAGLMMTLSKQNLHSIADAIAFGKSAGAAEIIFERFVPLGAGMAQRDATLNAADWKEAVDCILKGAKIDASVWDLLPYRAFRLFLQTEGALEGALCNLGDESMALMPDGQIYPCRRFDEAIADLRVDSFGEVLERLSAFGVTSFKRELTGPLCSNCPEACIGCRALARSLSDVRSDDPQCVKMLSLT